MKTVLIGWEMGGGLGHVMRAAAFAEALAAAGLRVVVALADLADCARVAWPDGILILPAPRPQRLALDFARPSTYAELLFSSGYSDVHQVAGLITGWFNLIDLSRADLLLADHAPSAHLAARLTGTPHMRIGSGFFAPPAGSPTPRYRTWESTDPLRARDAEHKVLSSINSAIEAAGGTPASTLADAVSPDVELIGSWPELDCYAQYRATGSVTYIGNERVQGQGIEASWPARDAGRKKRVVAYLKADYGPLADILSALERRFDTVAFVSGLSDEDRRRWGSESLWLAPEPLQLREAANQCDALVFHAGAGTGPVFLEAGKPVFMLPYSAEQLVNAIQIAAIGAGAHMDQAAVRSGFDTRFAEFMDDANYELAAQAIAARWSGRGDAIATAVASILHALDID